MNLFNFLKLFFFKLKEKNIYNSGVLLSKKIINQKTIKNFQDIEYSVFSQNGEDGIIDWIINSFGIDDRLNCIEIGCGDYLESNTRFLVKKRNWKSLIIDFDKNNIDLVKKDSLYWKHEITAIREKVTSENINEIIKKENFNQKLGLLSLDIDGNDYWILKSIDLNPIIIVCEFNSILGDIQEITVPYDVNFERSKKHYSNLYFGASINAFINLCKKKGYEFLGTDSKGVNAFFCRKDYFSKIDQKIEYKTIFRSVHREGRDKNLKLNYANFENQYKIIENSFFIDLKKNSNCKLNNFSNHIYTEEYKSGFINK